MSDETEQGHRQRAGASRRAFLRGAGGIAAASVAAVLTPREWGRAQAAAQNGAHADEACCASQSDIPLLAAAHYQGRYVALAASTAGPGLFELHVGSGGQVSLGAALRLQLPAGWVFASLGVVRGRLAITGGERFVFDAYDVNDEMTADVRAAIEVMPAEMPTSGVRRVEIMGVRPAVLLVDLQSGLIESLDLPPRPHCAFAVATSVTETASGALQMLIEHCDGFNESYYAAAVDMLTQSLDGQWSSFNLARELGESGPHYLASHGDALAVALNTAEGARILWPGPTAAAGALSTAVEGHVLMLRAGNAGFTALTRSTAGVRQLSGERGALVDAGAMSLRADSIIGAVPLAGAWGQSILLGRHSAQLVDESSGPTVRI